MSDFFKDPGDLESLNLSDISDIDPDEIEKIVKSAGDLDNKYLGFASGKSSQEVINKKGTSIKGVENALNQPILSEEKVVISEDAVPGSRISGKGSLPTTTEGPIGYGLKLDTENEAKTEKRPKSSADWLGLKDSPVRKPSFDADDYMRLKTDPVPPVNIEISPAQLPGKNLQYSPKKGPVPPIRNLLSDVERKVEKNRIIVSPERDLYSPPLPGDSPLKMSLKHKAAVQINKNKGKLIDELFGEAKRADEDNFRIGVVPESSKTDGGSKGDGYMPSATTNRRLDRRGGSAQRPPSSGLDGDFDWLLGAKPSTEKGKVIEPASPLSRSANPGPATPPVREVSSLTPNKGAKESKMPDWLEGIISDPPQKEPAPTVSSDTTVISQPRHLPKWLDGSSNAPQVLPSSNAPQLVQSTQIPITRQDTQPNPLSNLTPELDNDVHNNIAVKLASIQKELADAIARRNENLQIYMQVLIQEAQRVGSLPDINSDKNTSNTEANKKVADKEKQESENDKKDDLIKHQEDLVHDFEINVSRLELQNTQLEMKIENLKTTHGMEIEMLKKNHGFEISAWEMRFERMKTTFDETVEEYKRKISRLKENEEFLITEHKEKIKKINQDHLDKLEKLGEFHQIAIEQAATLTVPANIGQSSIRIPLKILNRPKDEVELTERESELLEKERHLEVLKAAVESEKRELDEALEVEKIRREEREREFRRQAMEVRLREEARQTEAKREREQLDAVALQVKLMREEALKEQGELAKEKLELAAERARLEATYTIQGRTEASMPPLDVMQARAEVEAALETARQAKEAAEFERRRQAEMRQAVEQITWEQKEMDLRLENREKHLKSMLCNAEKLRNEGLAALEEAKAMKEELDIQQKDIKEQLKQIETKERVLAKERLEIAKEKIELERRRAQLDIILPELTPAEELTLHPPKGYVDPKAVIMRLKAEKELESYICNQKL